jgi:uncharacterized repeat protein (TIGR03803 family)
MTTQQQPRIFSLGINLRAASIALTLTILFTLPLVPTRAVAQTYHVIHSFAGQPDGKYPEAGVTLDAAGNLYGTAYTGGLLNHGMVFKLTPKGILNDLYSFKGGNDGEDPMTRVVFGPDGTLYGATDSTVFNLKPFPSVCRTAQCPWSETLIATGLSTPGSGDLVFDSAKNIYGTTIYGGNGYGSAFECIYSNGKYACSDIYDFTRGVDGAYPNGVIRDNSGNLYGTAQEGGTYGYGTVFQLKPGDPQWSEMTFYSFVCLHNSDGCYPIAGLIFDPSGNLFGATSDSDNGSVEDGTVFELSPKGGWNTFTLSYIFDCQSCSFNGGPYASLFMDPKGNLWGTAYYDGPQQYGYGSIFELSPNGDGTYSQTYSYDFCSASGGKSPCTDGAYPLSNVVMDAAGNLYGTTSEGGSTGGNCGTAGCGVVWKLSPN